MRGQAGGNRAAHGARDQVGPQPPHSFFAQGVGAPDDVGAGGAARTGDQPGALIGHLAGVQAGIIDCLAHGHVGIGRGIAHEATCLALDVLVQVDRHGSADLAAQAHFRERLVKRDAGAAVAQRVGDGLLIIPQARNDAHARDGDSPHWCAPQKLSVDWNRPTRRSSAV
jgi:hypothetical protein